MSTYSHPGASNSNWRGGKSFHALYWTWHDMVRRCTKPNHKRFADYGGRGIQVCEQWRTDFWAYVADVGERPITGGRMTLDRIDNDGDYEPSNVRWATYSQQARNRRASAYAGLIHEPSTGRFAARRTA